MLRTLVKSKIEAAVVKDLEPRYEGSIGIDAELMEAADLVPGEKVHVLNRNNGERFETYVIEEERKSGAITLYGPAARLSQTGDKIYILSYVLVEDDETDEIERKVVRVDEENEIVETG